MVVRKRGGEIMVVRKRRGRPGPEDCGRNR